MDEATKTMTFSGEQEEQDGAAAPAMTTTPAEEPKMTAMAPSSNGDVAVDHRRVEAPAAGTRSFPNVAGGGGDPSSDGRKDGSSGATAPGPVNGAVVDDDGDDAALVRGRTDVVAAHDGNVGSAGGATAEAKDTIASRPDRGRNGHRSNGDGGGGGEFGGATSPADTPRKHKSHSPSSKRSVSSSSSPGGGGGFYERMMEKKRETDRKNEEAASAMMPDFKPVLSPARSSTKASTARPHDSGSPGGKGIYERMMEKKRETDRKNEEAASSMIPDFKPVLSPTKAKGARPRPQDASPGGIYERSVREREERERRNREAARASAPTFRPELVSSSSKKKKGRGGGEKTSPSASTASSSTAPVWQRLYDDGAERRTRNQLDLEEQKKRTGGVGATRVKSGGTGESNDRIQGLYQRGLKKGAVRRSLPRDESSAIRNRREEEELAQCTFKPKTNVGSGGPSSARSTTVVGGDTSTERGESTSGVRRDDPALDQAPPRVVEGGDQDRRTEVTNRRGKGASEELEPSSSSLGNAVLSDGVRSAETEGKKSKGAVSPPEDDGAALAELDVLEREFSDELEGVRREMVSDDVDASLRENSEASPPDGVGFTAVEVKAFAPIPSSDDIGALVELDVLEREFSKELDGVRREVSDDTSGVQDGGDAPDE